MSDEIITDSNPSPSDDFKDTPEYRAIMLEYQHDLKEITIKRERALNDALIQYKKEQRAVAIFKALDNA